MGDWCLVSARARQAGERLFRGALPSFARLDGSKTRLHTTLLHTIRLSTTLWLASVRLAAYTSWVCRHGGGSWFGTGAVPGWRITIVEPSIFSIVAIELLSLMCHHQIALIGDRYDYPHEVGFAGAGT